MITIEQARIIATVYKKFNDSETLEWTSIDDKMEFLAWLSDREVVTEAEVQLNDHSEKNARCAIDHPPEQCIVPVILDSISYICEDFKTSERLAKKARYVLEYYLALSNTGGILHD